MLLMLLMLYIKIYLCATNNGFFAFKMNYLMENFNKAEM